MGIPAVKEDEGCNNPLIPGTPQHINGNGGLLPECFFSSLPAGAPFVDGFHFCVRSAFGDMESRIERKELFSIVVA